MFKLITDCAELYDELWLEAAPFADYFDNNAVIEHNYRGNGDNYINVLKLAGKSEEFCEPTYSGDNPLVSARYFKRAAKRAVYRFLVSYTRHSLPWGSLTGIRPTHLAYEYLSDGGSEETLTDYLIENFDVSPKRAAITRDIISAQSKYYYKDPLRVNFYIHIPFCPSRCTYCSFTSLEYGKAKKYTQPYLDVLIDEIKYSTDIMNDFGLTTDSVYVGGGTPTSLDTSELKRLLEAVPFRGMEYTLEAGRPDTITHEKLSLCRDYGVTRICVNPQSLDEAVLVNIGRSHGRDEFFKAFEMAVGMGFIVNTDLIAGLPGQSYDSFRDDIRTLVELKPHNLTVHTLSIKNGAKMKNSGTVPQRAETEAMMDFAIDYLKAEGYMPYYLYRQKNMIGNLENIGFSLPGLQCANNITTMEECLSVIACGAGAIGKRVYTEGRIERLANLRDVGLYIETGRERFSKKRIFYSNQFTF